MKFYTIDKNNVFVGRKLLLFTPVFTIEFFLIFTFPTPWTDVNDYLQIAFLKLSA